MTETIYALMIWIGSHTGYSIPEHYPTVVFTDLHNMCVQYGINRKHRCDSSGLLGFYNKSSTIYLRLDFDVNNAAHRSFLLHELVHYVQWKNGKGNSTCLGHLELEAYELQDNWRVEQDLQPMMSEFNRMMLGASCG